MDDVKNRLAEMICTLNISQAKFAKSINVSPSSVSEWLKKHDVSPGKDALIRMSQVHNVNLNWLLTGNGPMFNPSIESITSIPSIPDFRHFRIQIVGEIAAGEPIAITNVEPIGYVPVDLSLIPNAAKCMAFKICGDSMSPEIIHGDVVIINPEYDICKLDKAIVAAQIDGANTLKTACVDNRGHHFVLHPINNRNHGSYIFDEDDMQDVRILGVLIFLIRKFI